MPLTQGVNCRSACDLAKLDTHNCSDICKLIPVFFLSRYFSVCTFSNKRSY